MAAPGGSSQTTTRSVVSAHAMSKWFHTGAHVPFRYNETRKNTYLYSKDCSDHPVDSWCVACQWQLKPDSCLHQFCGKGRWLNHSRAGKNEGQAQSSVGRVTLWCLRIGAGSPSGTLASVTIHSACQTQINPPVRHTPPVTYSYQSSQAKRDVYLQQGEFAIDCCDRV